MLLLKLLGALVLWMVIGYVIITGILIIHIILANRKGYDAFRWLDDYIAWKSSLIGSRFEYVCGLIIGFLIWPVRLIIFIMRDASSIYDDGYKTKI